ncbi:MAG TPA: thiamine-phosphate kinase [Candidatus Limnocylindrales bacterium]|nr:thiamine-phosphate kinase [Candidatus Limnocylindrales bacterium]HXJ15247.1 thiamine-phosphate kinase [Candidatus Limnocylindrales bacterium]
MNDFVDEDTLVSEIARHFLPSGGRKIRLGIGDDAALWEPRPGFVTILTSDWFLEGTHFLREKHPPDSVGWKCLARAASDIAAMGGRPRCFLLNLVLPAPATGKWLKGFLGGLRRAGNSLDCVLAGGDTTRGEGILVSVTVIGEIRKGREVLRSGARAGDALYVSGALGEAELGLRLLRKSRGKANRKNVAIRKHLYPEARVDLGGWLAERRLATAMMDVSDGLSSDLRRLCTASAVGAVIHPDRLPLPRGVQQQTARQLALHGGDDYELLFAVSPRNAARIPARYREIPLTRIGEISKGQGVQVLGQDEKPEPLHAAGWDPFR